MGLIPGRCFHHISKKPHTRISISKPRQSYVKGVPVSKIHQFEMGDIKNHSRFPLVYSIVMGEPRQIRSNALEAARQSATKYLTATLGETGFFLKIRPFPHHVLRNNPMATGAGADRFSQGMRMSWGKPIGQAARVYPKQRIMTARVPAGKDSVVREALRRASMKLSGISTIVQGA